MSTPVATSPPPAEYALLRDGGQVLIRPYAPEDRAAVAALFARLSPESRLMRFHSGGTRVEGEALDGITAGCALVAELGSTVVALANYVPLRDPKRAEMAIAVDDAQHGRGIGTVLFERLSRDARRDGVRRFLALVMTENTAMLAMLRDLGFRISRRFEGGVVEADVELRADPAYVARADARLHVAARASLGPLLRPRSVAVIGASRKHGTIGHELFRNLLAGGFDGPVYPVNPSAAAVASVRAYPSVFAIGAPVDLGVVVVPAARVLDAAREALDAGVRALVVISAGFAEVGAEAARAVVEAALAREERPWLRAEEVEWLLRAYGVLLPRGVVAHSPEEAAAAFDAIGGPVVAKLVSSTVLHKLDVGGVRLDLRTAAATAAAYHAIEAELAQRGLSAGFEGVLVQRMERGGVETIVGVVTDPTFGPLIAFGSGGVLAEALGDVAFRLHPLTDDDADELIGSTRAATLLRGYRGALPADTAALRGLLLHVSRLVEDVPEIVELDLNPVLCRPAGQGLVALDARVRLARPA